MPEEGLRLYKNFVKERIIDVSVNFWDTLPNVKFKLFKSTAKKVRIPTTNGVIEITKDQKLLNRLIMLCRSRQDIDIKECIGKYELSVVPRSLFARDGSMNHTQGKAS